MITKYINRSMFKYDNKETHFVEIKGIDGLIGTGDTLDEAMSHLALNLGPFIILLERMDEPEYDIDFLREIENRLILDQIKEVNQDITIFIDMDGTLADTYNVPNWFDYIKECNAELFSLAQPADPTEVMDYLNDLGPNRVVVTMLPEPMEDEAENEIYYEEVKKVKMEWLEKFFPQLNPKVIFIPYGHTKSDVINSREDILIDDSLRQLKEWDGEAIKSPWNKSLDEALRELKLEGREEIR